jgi:proteic killer suppression protein
MHAIISVLINQLTKYSLWSTLISIGMDVFLSKKAQKDLTKIPPNIQRKFLSWAKTVAEFGLQKVRLSKGFHDEPLTGQRQGQRSIRLNRAYRAIYIIDLNGHIEFVEVIEVNKHDY